MVAAPARRRKAPRAYGFARWRGSAARRSRARAPDGGYARGVKPTSLARRQAPPLEFQILATARVTGRRRIGGRRQNSRSLSTTCRSPRAAFRRPPRVRRRALTRASPLDLTRRQRQADRKGAPPARTRSALPPSHTRPTTRRAPRFRGRSADARARRTLRRELAQQQMGVSGSAPPRAAAARNDRTRAARRPLVHGSHARAGSARRGRAAAGATGVIIGPTSASPGHDHSPRRCRTSTARVRPRTRKYMTPAGCATPRCARGIKVRKSPRLPNRGRGARVLVTARPVGSRARRHFGWLEALGPPPPSHSPYTTQPRAQTEGVSGGT